MEPDYNTVYATTSFSLWSKSQPFQDDAFQYFINEIIILFHHCNKPAIHNSLQLHNFQINVNKVQHNNNYAHSHLPTVTTATNKVSLNLNHVLSCVTGER